VFIYYRGYILIRLKIIGTQDKIVQKLKNLKPSDQNEDWKVTYATAVYGGWDVLVECIFTNLEDLYKMLSFCRFDEDLSQWIEATTTLLSIKKDFTI